MNFSEYWLISAPIEKSKSSLGLPPLNHLNQITIKQDLSINWKFRMPELKIGTIDSLFALTDGLDKVDSYVEQVTRKVANQLIDVLEDHYNQGYGNMDCRFFNFPKKSLLSNQVHSEKINCTVLLKDCHGQFLVSIKQPSLDI